MQLGRCKQWARESTRGCNREGASSAVGESPQGCNREGVSKDAGVGLRGCNKKVGRA